VKAFVVSGSDAGEVREWPEPASADDELVVEPLLVGVCGTDLELIDATIDPAYVRYPLVLGHEWVGRLAPDIAGDSSDGVNVVVEGVIPCDICDECARGATNRCVIYDEIGFTRPGALAERISVPSRLIHRLGPDVALDDAVLVEPMAVVWRALTRVALRRGLEVAVIGDGTIALLAAHMVQLFEPKSTAVLGRREEQRDLALRSGADAFEVVAPSRQYDLVIEASGSSEGVSAAINRCARGGMVILLGLPPHGSRVEVAPDDLVNNDLIIQGSFSYTREAFAEVVRRVNLHELNPSFLITHRFKLDEATAAMAALRHVAVGCPRGKVVVSVRDGDGS
jgi:2-desacetyl-2-hydroxyethyl bacteriochlorophyllide A dehydrogenase